MSHNQPWSRSRKPGRDALRMAAGRGGSKPKDRRQPDPQANVRFDSTSAEIGWIPWGPWTHPNGCLATGTMTVANGPNYRLGVDAGGVLCFSSQQAQFNGPFHAVVMYGVRDGANRTALLESLSRVLNRIVVDRFPFLAPMPAPSGGLALHAAGWPWNFLVPIPYNCSPEGFIPGEGAWVDEVVLFALVRKSFAHHRTDCRRDSKIELLSHSPEAQEILRSERVRHFHQEINAQVGSVVRVTSHIETRLPMKAMRRLALLLRRLGWSMVAVRDPK